MQISDPNTSDPLPVRDQACTTHLVASNTSIRTFIMNTQCQFFARVADICRVPNLQRVCQLAMPEGKHVKESTLHIYTVRLPIGGRKTLMSGRVINSGYIPPVSSNNARRSRLSDLVSDQHTCTCTDMKDAHAEPLCHTRQIPNGFYRRLADGHFHTGPHIRPLTPVLIPQRRTLDHELPIDLDITPLCCIVQFGQLHMCLRYRNTRARVQTSLFDFILEHLRDEVPPRVKADDLGFVKPCGLGRD